MTTYLRPMKIGRKQLFQLSLATIFGFSALAYLLIVLFHEERFSDIIIRSVYQAGFIPIGIAFGCAAGFTASWISDFSVFSEVREFFAKMLNGMDIDLHDITFVSFCAGFGEELFFRVALQPLVGWALVSALLHLMAFGAQAPDAFFPLTEWAEMSLMQQYHWAIWPTAILFVALHGYLNPLDWKMTVFGLFLVFVSAGLGYLYCIYGFFAAVSGHMAYDWVVFWYLLKRTRPKLR